MAKHPDDNPQRNPGEDALGDELPGDEPGAADPTQISKKSAPPTHIAKKAAPPTQLAPEGGPERGRGPDTPPKMPRLSIDAHGHGDEDEIVEAESVEEEVFDAQPVSDATRREDAKAAGASSAIEIAPVEDVTEAASLGDEDVLAADVLESGSSLRRGSESPPALEAHPASDIILAEAVDSGRRPSEEVELGEDVVQEPGKAAKPESDIQRQASQHEAGKREAGQRERKEVDFEATDVFEAVEAPPSDVAEAELAEEADAEDTIAADAVDGDDSSAVDFGRTTIGSSSNIGVDPVAEALESGVNLEAPPSKRARTPATPLDDQLAHQGAPRSKRTKHDDTTDLDVAAFDAEAHAEAKAAADAEADAEAEAEADAEADAEAAAADLLADDTRPPESVEDEAAALLAEAPSGARERTDDDVTADDATEAVADKAATDAEAEDEEERKPKKKKKMKREPALVGAGAATSASAAHGGRGGRGGWLGGTLLGIVLTAVGAGAVWYLAPDLIPESPNAQAKPKALPAPPPPPPPPLSLAQRARTEIDQNNYDAAVEMLKDLPAEEKTPANLSARAEARWLKYQKEQADKKAPLNPADEAAKAVLADLAEAKNDLVKNQVQKTLGHDALSAQLAAQKESGKALAQLQNALAQAKIVGDKADPKEIAAAVSQAITAKEQAEKRLAELAKPLVDAKQIDAADKLDAAAMQKLVQAASANQNAMAEVNKLLAKAEIKEQGLKGIAELVTAKKSADDKLDAAHKQLTAANAKDLKELIAARQQAEKERDRLNQALKTAYQELAGAKLPPGADPAKDLAAAAKAARQQGESPLAVPLGQLARTFGGLGQGVGTAVRNAFETTALVAELNYYRLREPLIQQPAQRLDAYIALYENRGNTAGSEQALKDARWVLDPAAESSPEAQAKAHYVVALVKRNQQQFAEAQKSAQAAAANLAKAKTPGPWVESFKRTQAELADPAAYYLPRIDEAQSSGNIKVAVAEIGSALKVLPDNPRLLAQRALLQLDSVSGQGKAMPAAVQKAIRADAAGALKDPKTASEGQYALGLLEEELRRYDEAEKHLRAALKTAPDAEAASRYRLALGRVLLQERTQVSTPAPQPPAPKPAPKPAPQPAPKQENKEEKKKDAAEPKLEETSQAYPLGALVAAAALGQAGGETSDPAAEARIQESIKLAQELINSDNRRIKGHGHMLLGQALSKQGKRTEGLREYIKGVEMAYPGIGAKELNRMIDEHPAFQQPDVTARPNPYLAETHFGKGLHLYFANLYPEAEGQFKQAVEYYGQDARYQYFLGLAQYAQSTKAKRDAAFYSFEQAARLEAENRPTVDEVNASLERVQGDNRRLINHFRAKALEASR